MKGAAVSVPTLIPTSTESKAVLGPDWNELRVGNFEGGGRITVVKIVVGGGK